MCVESPPSSPAKIRATRRRAGAPPPFLTRVAAEPRSRGLAIVKPDAKRLAARRVLAPSIGYVDETADCAGLIPLVAPGMRAGRGRGRTTPFALASGSRTI